MANAQIMCTLTPRQVEDESLLRQMVSAGMQSVRLNTAHFDTPEQLGLVARRLKSLCPGLGVLIDTKGPEMRTGPFQPQGSGLAAWSLSLSQGQTLTVGRAGSVADIEVSYPELHRYAQPEHRLLIDDGRIALRVNGVEDAMIHCTVDCGGVLGGRKGIALEGIDLPLPSLSDKDRDFILYASTAREVDVIAHSFVRNVDDVLSVKALLRGSKPVVAKIENQQGVDNLASILSVSDGVLIARGDLTASLGAASIPRTQARIAKVAKQAGLPLYLATNVLPSLMVSSEPSREDVEGIRHAKAQGVDVMLLTNETAAGPRPVMSVKTLRDVLAY